MMLQLPLRHVPTPHHIVKWHSVPSQGLKWYLSGHQAKIRFLPAGYSRHTSYLASNLVWLQLWSIVLHPSLCPHLQAPHLTFKTVCLAFHLAMRYAGSQILPPVLRLSELSTPSPPAPQG